MTGWYAVKRGMVDHEAMRPRGKWSRIEAWLWILDNAAWKPTPVDIGGMPYTVPRGALCYSLRFMARKWKWSTKAVQTFLRDLSSHGVIKTEVIFGGHKKETQRTRITLCNYEKYQATGNAKETDGKRTGNKEEQGNKDSVPSERDVPSEPIEVSVESSAVWNAGKPFLASRGIDNPGALIGKWLKSYPPLEVLAALGAAQKAGTHDPIPYITETLKGQPHGKPSRSADRVANFIAGARDS